MSAFTKRLREAESAATKGPWYEGTLHGSAMLAAIARGAEQHPTDVPRQVVRLTVDMMRAAPMSPLRITPRSNPAQNLPGRPCSTSAPTVSSASAWSSAAVIALMTDDDSAFALPSSRCTTTTSSMRSMVTASPRCSLPDSLMAAPYRGVRRPNSRRQSVQASATSHTASTLHTATATSHSHR